MTEGQARKIKRIPRELIAAQRKLQRLRIRQCRLPGQIEAAKAKVAALQKGMSQ